VDANSRCHLCADSLGVGGYRVRDIVSDNSTIWDDLLPPADSTPALLCTPCAWAFRKEDARREAVIVTGDSYATCSFRAAGVRLLEPLDTTTALSAPISGRKHVLPFLAWGSVSTDTDSSMAWGLREADLAKAVLRLRIAGAQWRDLADGRVGFTGPNPSELVYSDWESVARWRGSPQLNFIVSLLRKGGLSPGDRDG
jgi:hypothetical protein